MKTATMATPRVCVLRAPGTNCDVETAFAFDTCGGAAERVHLFRLFEQPDLLERFQVLCLPGGFSYGDDVGAGVVCGDQLQSRLGEALGRFLEADKLVLGICNGFQVLLKSGILPGGHAGWTSGANTERTTTLTWNTNGKYTALWVSIDVCSPQSVFLRGLERFELPVAHAEGRLALRDPGQLAELESGRQVALRYADPQGSSSPDGYGGVLPYPLNPNGSIANIAGLCDPSGRILGLMPHPERFLFRTQHPRWTRSDAPTHAAGRQIFENAIEYFGST
jgi:phosphoribosylformylglycinamidine synthase